MPDVTAVVSFIGVVSRTSDRILPGAIKGRAPVILSGWNHSAIKTGEPPVGKGVVFEKDNEIIFEGDYFSFVDAEKLNAAIKELNDGEDGKPEWSLTYLPLKQTIVEEEDEGLVWEMMDIESIEVSPVYRGNVDDTRTISINSISKTPAKLMGDKGERARNPLYKETAPARERTNEQQVAEKEGTVETTPQEGTDNEPKETPPNSENEPENNPEATEQQQSANDGTDGEGTQESQSGESAETEEQALSPGEAYLREMRSRHLDSDDEE